MWIDVRGLTGMTTLGIRDTNEMDGQSADTRTLVSQMMSTDRRDPTANRITRTTARAEMDLTRPNGSGEEGITDRDKVWGLPGKGKTMAEKEGAIGKPRSRDVGIRETATASPMRMNGHRMVILTTLWNFLLFSPWATQSHSDYVRKRFDVCGEGMGVPKALIPLVIESATLGGFFLRSVWCFPFDWYLPKCE